MTTRSAPAPSREHPAWLPGESSGPLGGRRVYIDAAGPLVDTLREGVVLDGRSLMCVGLQLPRMHPQASFILRLTRQG